MNSVSNPKLNNDDKINILKSWINSSPNIVFMGGAGVSTASGIPDYRGAKGRYKMKYNYPLEDILSIDFLRKDPSIYYDYYRGNLKDNYQPNIVHKRLAELENEGKIKAIITQNIDGLHQQAGSRNVIELHGSVYRYYCTDCKIKYNKDFVDGCEGVPICNNCGGVIRPSVVLFGENLEDYVIKTCIETIYNADTLIIGGTSLVVYPAAGYIKYFKGEHLVLLNNEPTSIDGYADLVIYDNIENIFAKI